MYKYQVNYSKRFTSGMFTGKLMHDYIRFADWHSADEFKTKCESGHEFTPCAGDGSYKVEDVSLFAIEPTTVRTQKRDKVNGQYV
jgi:hypothetical protein